MMEQEIAEIPRKQVYEWVKTGAWGFREFQSWYNAVCWVSYSDGYGDNQ
jgi:hypothetical protein